MPPVHAELRAQGVRIGHNSVDRLMRAAGLAGVSRRKHTVTTVRGRDGHGDSLGAATSVGVPSTTAGRIDRAGDNDYFRFQVGTAGTIRAYTTGATDTCGYLYDGAGTELASSDDAGDVNFRIERAVSPGTYDVRVRHFDSVSTGAYSLRIELVGSGPTPTPTRTPTRPATNTPTRTFTPTQPRSLSCPEGLGSGANGVSWPPNQRLA